MLPASQHPWSPAPISGPVSRQRSLPGTELVDLCEDLRGFADPAVAAVYVWGSGHAEARSVVISPQQCDLEASQALGVWLGSLDRADHVSVPGALRRPLCAFKAWVAPIATPGGVYGGVALPTLGLGRAEQRRVAALLSDFALRFESSERKAALRWLRANSERQSSARFAG